VPTQRWQPVASAERYAALDALRGIALLGVLLVNLLSDFRIPLAEHISTFHTQPGWADRAVDVLAAGLLEFKAFAVFSLLFGVGLAVVAERAAARHIHVGRFLVRRLLILLAIGLGHLLLIWNGDILSLYAVCGLMLCPLLRLPVATLAAVGLAAVALTFIIPWGFLWPAEDTLRGLASEAARVYPDGSFGEILAFHWRETQLLILPLLVASIPKVWGLMALGAAGWRAGVFQEPRRHRGLLWGIILVGGALGGSMTAVSVYSASTGHSTGVPSLLIEAGSYLPLALAYAAGLLLVLQSPRVAWIAAPFAAAGQMALTNYLAQSVILSLLFYGYGLGLSGRLGSAAAAVIGLALYAAQLAFSQAWLRRYRFGPVEWLWRSITYGQRLPMRRDAGGRPSPAPQPRDDSPGLPEDPRPER
jgi:uncharacterized protein